MGNAFSTDGNHLSHRWELPFPPMILLRTLCAVLLMVVGTVSVWGQVSEGFYYLANKSSKVDNVANASAYSSSSPSTNFYLCPAIGCYYDNNVDQPHLTTFRTNQDQNSIWRIVAVSGETDCYYLIHYKTGKYLKSNETPNYNIDGGKNRKVVHLEVKTNDDDEFKFYIKNNSGTYQIYPKIYKPGGTLTNASSMSLNVKGDQWTCYVPQNGLATGIIGVYAYSGNAGSQWAFESVSSTTPCATPIVKYSGEQINISYPYSDETGITIYYTTDGTAPTTSSAHQTSNSFNISASGVVKVRAFAAKSGLADSDEAVLLGSARPFLFQSREDINYYLVPSGDETKVNTSSIAGEKMQWTMESAGSSTGGVPYYYLVNSNGKKIKYNSDFTLSMDTGTDDANKFCVIENGNTGYVFLIPISGATTGDNKTCRSVFKTNGNVASDVVNASEVKANSDDNINRGQWIVRLCNAGSDQKSLFTAPPFTASDESETHYYHIQSVGSSGYYIVPPAEESGYATTSNTTADYTNSPWIFKVASSDNWLTYYYIIDAATGKYMYFNPDNGSTKDQANVISMKDISESTNETADKYQFIMVHSTTTDACYIVSKGYANNFRENKYYGLWRDDTNPLKTTWSRKADANNVKWTFSEASITSLYLDPVVTQDEQGYITFIHPTNACDFYYTTDGTNDPTVPASSETVPTAPTIKYTGTFTPEVGVTQIRVIAVSKSNYSAQSSVVTYNLPQLSKPTVTFDNVTNEVTITSLSGATIYYTYGTTEPIADPTVNESVTHDSSPVTFTISEKTYVKALAVKGGFTTSDVYSHVIDKVATPSKLVTPDSKVMLTCATLDASLYYTIGETEDIADPTTTSTRYTNPIENASGKYIKVIAVKDGWITSDVYSSGEIRLQCATPVIKRETGDKFSITCAFPTEGVTIYYTTDGTTPSSSILYDGQVSISSYPVVIKAIAIADGYDNSEIAEKTIEEGLAVEDGYYEIASAGDFALFVTLVNTEGGAAYNYHVTDDFTISGSTAITTAFTGTFDGDMHTISGLDHALFNTINGGTVKNVMLDNVSISGGTNVGAICNEATGDSRIYNCGVLATGSTVEKDEKGYDKITSCSSTVSGSGYVGGLVGLLDGSSRVINCFSYANITGGNLVGGIVGKNNVATTSANLKTMVMNCMFYGDITGGTNKAPIYNGTKISNQDANGVSNYNYFCAEASYVKDEDIQTYNCALLAETRYLQRFEFFRHLLNSHRELAAWWATGDRGNKDQMMKWVLEPSQIGTSTPYPILKTPGKYASVVNIDAENATQQSERNKGGNLGTLTVYIQMGSGGAQFGPPTGATITTSSLTLNITDKDPDHFNFNYGKVQLPYYNDVGAGNYGLADSNDPTSGRVVTGWKIVGITTDGSVASYNTFTTGDDATANAEGEITAAPYNFADRYCTEKDLYSKSGRVFNQGAYWDVPEGVTAITIEPYWAKAAYLADGNADVVYNSTMKTAYNVPTVGGGQIYTNNTNYSIAGEDQKVYTVIDDARDALGKHSGHTVYDYAIVLVGNYHKHNGVSSGDAAHFYTIMSADFDHDNEPDYSYILRFDGRCETHPVRVDFLNIPGLGMAQKSTDGTGTFNFGILIPKGWFESTNTSLFRFTQFEYEHSSRPADAPLILQGGVMEQWVSFSQKGVSQKTPYFHVGGNVWFKEFHRGTHQDRQQNSKHPPISVTGGDFDEFYLTGLYRADFANYNDNLECYINGGRFGIVAGAAQEGAGNASDHTNGNVVWQIQNADIDEFYGGGLNAVHPVEGNITTVITGGYIKQFCGGPKFGDMNSGKKVITTANGCTFDTFYGAGYGGNSYSRFTPTNINEINGDYGESNWNTWLNNEYKQEYNSTYGGVSTTFFTQYIPFSNNYQNVARLLIDFVSFSLATTRDVTSSLTDCTINQNFYGGGKLGMVDGPVHSTLTDCTVKGNVFGAGYSGTQPTVEVMNTGGFVKAPRYDANLGVYFDPVFPATVTYTWQHRDETVNSTTRAIDKDYHILYTNEDLTTLGTVTGQVTLNIESGTAVTGSVYGGGESSDVSGKDKDKVVTSHVKVNVKGGSMANVFGGGYGKNTVVAGDVTVNIGTKTVVDGSTVTYSGDGTVSGSVYGGSAMGAVNASATKDAKGDVTEYTPSDGKTTQVNIYAGTVNGSVFGGGLGQTSPKAIAARSFGNTSVTMEGGEVATAVYGGSNANGVLKQDATVTITGGTVGTAPGTGESIANAVFGGGFGEPTRVEGAVEVNIGRKKTGSETEHTGTALIYGNVYGGGALGSVNVDDALASTTYTVTEESTTTTKYYTTDVNLYAGTIYGNVFGGGLGQKNGVNGAESDILSYVGGDVQVLLDGAKITGNVFGCNNLNGTPKGHVKVWVKRTVDSNKPTVDSESKTIDRDHRPYTGTTYDVAAVYGGGNQADYIPTKATGSDADKEAACAEVLIEGCDATSIQYVYGGGNAAAVPATDVTIKGSYIIDYVFGGGNGAGEGNPGANVGIYDNSGTSENYGSGKAVTKLYAGKIHVVYGGSNTRGNVRGGTSVSMPQLPSDHTSPEFCDALDVREIYGAGQNAEQDGGVTMILGCVTGLENVYGGAKDANVKGGVDLVITSGHFSKVFGGNDTSGTIQGPITVTIEETGCDPVTIDELYLGGNNAAYSVYGYKVETLVARTQDEYETLIDGKTDEEIAALGLPYANPVLNVVSCTSIGHVFGGGYGTTATMYGSPTVNINMIPGKYADQIDRDGTPGADNDANAIGAIGNVYGGGNAADVIGDTHVNICTEPTVAVRTYMGAEIAVGDRTPKAVQPAYITGDVFGAGKGDPDHVDYAKVSGNTYIVMADGSVAKSVYGGGELSQVGGNTTITVSGGTIGDSTGANAGETYGNVYGGGKGNTTNVLAGRVQGNTNITIQNHVADEDYHTTHPETAVGTVLSSPSIYHNIYGGGAYGSVGTFTYDTDNTNDIPDGTPISCTANTGIARITITGGTIGIDGHENGMIFGSSRGDVGKPGSIHDNLAWVYDTHVIIGTEGSETGPDIKGSLYGSGENGHTYHDASVTMYSGTVGIPGEPYPYRGNVYGGGCGTDMYWKDANSNNNKDAGEEHYNPKAGIVLQGNATVTINGGSIANNIYGAGAMGKVEGNTVVIINTDGAIGVDGEHDDGNVYGAARGELDLDDDYDYSSVTNSSVTISKGTVKGSVFGGGKAGSVKGTVTVNMTGGTVMHDVYGGGALAKTNTLYDASDETYKTYVTTVALSGGTITGDLYGGGLGQLAVAAVAADVNGPVTVTVSGGKAANVFGCNNLNGAPKSTVAVTVSGTETVALGSAIGNVYGGGNLAAYTGSPTVTISGGTVNQVYGGGLGASAIVDGSTSVTISGTAVVGNDVFGGGSEANVTGSVSVSVTGGQVINDVYGGGEKANTNTGNWDTSTNTWKVASSSDHDYYVAVKHLKTGDDVSAFYTDPDTQASGTYMWRGLPITRS